MTVKSDATGVVAPAGSQDLSQLQKLVIRAELEQMLSDFWHEVDVNDGREAAGFYTEDGVFEASTYTYTGRDIIEKFYRYRQDRGPRVALHVVSNFRVDIEAADRATTHWYLTLYADDGEPVLPSAPPIQIGRSIDTCVKTEDGRWRIQYRKFEIFFKGGVPTTSPKL